MMQNTQPIIAQGGTTNQVPGAGGVPLAMGNPFFPMLPGMMHHMAAAPQNPPPMIAIAKLSTSKSKKETNSSIVVRNTVLRFGRGGLLSVAEYVRKTLEENVEWLVKLVKRSAPSENAVVLVYGDGWETLVLMDDHIGKMPEDIARLKRIPIGCSMASIDSDGEEVKLAKCGVLSVTDSMWDHLRYEASGESKDAANALWIHTKATVWGDAIDGRRRVLLVSSGPHMKYRPNGAFEAEVLQKWTAMTMMTPPKPQVEEDDGMKEVMITFNPKELLLLEKAWDNRLTQRDLKNPANKCTEQDKVACQAVIKRLHDEFVFRGPSRKRRPKVEANAATHASKKVKHDEEPPSAPKSMASSSPKKVNLKPSTPSKSSNKASQKDEDDQPISKMVNAKKTENASKKTKGKPTRTMKETKPKDSSKAKGKVLKESTSKTNSKAVKLETPKSNEKMSKEQKSSAKKAKAATPKKVSTRGRATTSTNQKPKSPRKRSSSRSKK